MKDNQMNSGLINQFSKKKIQPLASYACPFYRSSIFISKTFCHSKTLESSLPLGFEELLEK